MLIFTSRNDTDPDASFVNCCRTVLHWTGVSDTTLHRDIQTNKWLIPMVLIDLDCCCAMVQVQIAISAPLAL
jgi:hypothetical protein